MVSQWLNKQRLKVQPGTVPLCVWHAQTMPFLETRIDTRALLLNQAGHGVCQMPVKTCHVTVLASVEYLPAFRAYCCELS